ncbi:MAG: hypothetical protein AAFY59_12380, partial [Pseudomonadota bacterium]
QPKDARPVIFFFEKISSSELRAGGAPEILCLRRGYFNEEERLFRKLERAVQAGKPMTAEGEDGVSLGSVPETPLPFLEG